MIHSAIKSKHIMKNFFLIKLFVAYFIIITSSVAVQSTYLEKGIQLFEKKKYKESKILFEREIVFNPKSEKSYLYLAKIFKRNENDEEQEMNLNTVLLLNPKNDEAIYMLTLLKIKQSDYEQTKDLINKFTLVCKSFCSKEKEIRKKFEKLIPEDEKNNN